MKDKGKKRAERPITKKEFHHILKRASQPVKKSDSI